MRRSNHFLRLEGFAKKCRAAGLPDEVLVEILLWLPTKSIVRFRCVCKLWKSLFASPLFVGAHFDRTFKLHKYDLLKYDALSGALDGCSRLRIRYYDTPEFSNLVPSFNQYHSIIDIIDSCNGVICLATFHDRRNGGIIYSGSGYNKNIRQDSKIFLWNPSINEKVILPTPYFQVSDFIGFGIDSSSGHLDDFKVVNINVYYEGWPDQSSQVEVYSFRGNNWKQIGDIYPSKHNKCLNNQVIIGKHICWCTRVCCQQVAMIILYDVADEVFNEIALPDFMPLGEYYITALHECLSVIAFITSSSSTKSCEVWMMKEFNVNESWTMLYRFDIELSSRYIRRNIRPLGFTNSGEIFFIKKYYLDGSHKTYPKSYLTLYKVKEDEFVQFKVEADSPFTFEVNISDPHLTGRLVTHSESLISLLSIE